MERDQIEESKNRTIYNAGTIAVIDSVYEERERLSTDFPRKIWRVWPAFAHQLPRFYAKPRSNVARLHHPALMLRSGIIAMEKGTKQ